MAAPSLATALDPASRRSLPRYPIDVLVDVVALQSGIPHNMPGRCTDLSEAGLGAVVAGELIKGQAVAIEFRLPHVGLPVRARAQVRYQERLRCGLQFVGLTLEQREKIRYWSSQIAPQAVHTRTSRVEVPVAEFPALAVVPEAATDTVRDERRVRVPRRRFLVLAALILALGGLAWWQWQNAWNALEEEISGPAEFHAGLPVRVPSETMDRQIVYKVDPVYPVAAREMGTQGLVVLAAVIAPDGRVKRLRAVAGPEVLAQSALDAVESWRYTPYRVDGQAVEVETSISVDFRLH